MIPPRYTPNDYQIAYDSILQRLSQLPTKRIQAYLNIIEPRGCFDWIQYTFNPIRQGKHSATLHNLIGREKHTTELPAKLSLFPKQ